MSYNTGEILQSKNMSMEDFQALPEQEKKDIFYEALQVQLPLGVAWMEQAIENFKQGKRDEDHAERLVVTEDPHSETGKQAIRLFFDIPRKIFEERHGVVIGSYNCCKAVIAENTANLGLSLEEQFALQSTPDC